MNQPTETRVKNGMTLLDAARPGWEQHIDLAGLDINDPECCILGQLFGHYSLGITALSLIEDDLAIIHGFIAAGKVDELRLEIEWILQLNIRQLNQSEQMKNI